MTMNDALLVMGIDGGGTKTKVLLAETDGGSSEPRIVGEGIGGPSNAVAIPFEQAAANVAEAIRQATAEAQIDVKQVCAVCFAMAGAGRESVRDSWQQWSQSQGVSNGVVVSDVAAVFAASCKSGVGVALISGTGSVAYGQNSKGQTARVGGWGHLISDEGSGYWIARQALKAIVQAEDGLAVPTLLTAKFLEELQVDTVTELVREVSRYDRRETANWSSLVFQAAKEDEVADKILRQASTHLSTSVVNVANQLKLGSEFEVGLAGGILIHNDSFRAKLIAELSNSGMSPSCTLIEEPVNGALELAIQYSKPADGH